MRAAFIGSSQAFSSTAPPSPPLLELVEPLLEPPVVPLAPCPLLELVAAPVVPLAVCPLVPVVDVPALPPAPLLAVDDPPAAASTAAPEVVDPLEQATVNATTGERMERRRSRFPMGSVYPSRRTDRASFLWNDFERL
jgi:hypothetical protein